MDNLSNNFYTSQAADSAAAIIATPEIKAGQA
jgi:hypothetical protein